MIKYIAFDFDGTLVDSKEVFLDIFNQIAEKRGFQKLNAGNIEYLRTLSITERCNFLKVPLYKVPFIAIEFLKDYKKSIDRLVLIDGIREVLEQLHNQGLELVIISSNSEKNIRTFLDLQGINCIRQIFCSSNIFGKESLIRKFLKSSGLNASEVIYIGDEVRDIEACRKAGIPIIWVNWGYDLREITEPHKPDFIAEKPSDIVQIISSKLLS